LSDDLSLGLFEEEQDESTKPAQPPVPEVRVWSVSQVNRAVKGLLDANVESLWIGGEIGQWTRSRAGHCYFTLKDERAQLRSVMFAREASFLPTDPDEGMKVRCYGDLTLYEARGDYQMVVRRVEADGAEGLWRKAFEELRVLLEREGLLAAERKRALPRYPKTIGVVTSPTGAALRDILAVLGRRAPWVRVLVSGAGVQGQGASTEVAQAIERLVTHAAPDVIIVGRGGGSMEDLWAFNEEVLARAITQCPIPVVSAVGHEVDVTISDLVADARAPTPSAAAELVVPDGVRLLARVRESPQRLGRGLRRASERRRREVSQQLARLARAMELRVRPARQTLDMGARSLETELRQRIERQQAALAGFAGRLEALSPLATLARGYSVARTPEGEVLRRRRDFHAGRRFHLRLMDGSVVAEAIEQIEDKVEER